MSLSGKLDASQAGAFDMGARWRHSDPKGVQAVNRNVGIIDRMLRVGCGLTLIGMALEGPNDRKESS
jgi:hypothetical protein